MLIQHAPYLLKYLFNILILSISFKHSRLKQYLLTWMKRYNKRCPSHSVLDLCFLRILLPVLVCPLELCCVSCFDLRSDESR